VVSIGIGGVWDFEEHAAQRGCEVHAFDPTIALRATHERFVQNYANIHFHYVGLGDTRIYRGGYTMGGAPDLSEVAHLPELLERAGAAARRVDILKIDCEGCEWREFKHLKERAPQTLCSVEQLLIELHVSSTLQLSDADQLIVLAEHLFVDHGFHIFQHHLNWGFGIDRRSFADSVKKLLHMNFMNSDADTSPCCDELHMIRPARASRTARICDATRSTASGWVNMTPI